MILHHEGAYNLYSTVSDATEFSSALDLGQLYQVVRVAGGQRAVDALPERIRRAQQYGSSSGESLDDAIYINRAGPGESRLSLQDFIAKYLTLP